MFFVVLHGKMRLSHPADPTFPCRAIPKNPFFLILRSVGVGISGSKLLFISLCLRLFRYINIYFFIILCICLYIACNCILLYLSLYLYSMQLHPIAFWSESDQKRPSYACARRSPVVIFNWSRYAKDGISLRGSPRPLRELPPQPLPC